MKFRAAFGLLIIATILAGAFLLGLIKFGNDPWVDKLRVQTKALIGHGNDYFNDRPDGLKHADHKEYLNSLKQQYSQNPPIPQMITISSGTFKSGCVEGQCPKQNAPGPLHTLESFQIAATETTLEQWDTCVAMGGCQHLPDNYGWGRGQLPVMNVSFGDAQDYIAWLNQNTDGGYRLPTDAEWEYAARAGTDSSFPWGEETPDCDTARLGSPSWRPVDKHECKLTGTRPVGQHAPNAWGLYDVIGNAAEWTQGCGQKIGAVAPRQLPTVALERLSDLIEQDCSLRINRGGNLMTSPKTVNVWHARAYSANHRYNRVGLRLARTLPTQ